MALVQEPEVLLAQKLASNEKPIRTKALKKLRKYINVRSQKETEGFSSDELLKLWKGLFYCLWMQDKPLLQEELSSQISNLIHSFHSIDGQLLYLESCLLTFKREWTGIDRLRMDKFFQLVRFMFRHTFEMLKRRNWEKSVVARFLELFSAQVLQSGSEAPMGLQFHILDLYMTELAAVGASELTADQNLMFVEPFVKTASKTKDRTLFTAVCNSIFSSIIDQAPFAIEDLMKEMKEADDDDSDSGQASDEEDQATEKISKPPVKTGRGHKFHEDEEDDPEMPYEEDVGPVLQFDYLALADRLFEFARRSNAPSYNRQRLYKIIKALKDLGEGIFPQDEYPEEVSTDEDDDMFGSRKRMKKRKRSMDEDLNGTFAAKKSKGKKKDAATPQEQNKDLDKDGEQVDQTNHDGERKRRKKKKKKKTDQGGISAGDEKTEISEQEIAGAQSPQQVTEVNDSEPNPPCAGAEAFENKAEVQTSSSGVEATEEAPAKGRPEVKAQPSATETEEAAQTMSRTSDEDQGEKDSSTPNAESVADEEQRTSAPIEPEASARDDCPGSGRKKKKKKRKAAGTTDGADTSQVFAETEIGGGATDVPVLEETVTPLATSPPNDTTPTKRKQKKGKRTKNKREGGEAQSQIDGASPEESLAREDSAKNLAKSAEASDEACAARTSTKKSPKVDDRVEENETVSEESQCTTEEPVKKKRQGKQKVAPTLVAPPVVDDAVTPLPNQKEADTVVNNNDVMEETPERPDAEGALAPPAKKRQAPKQAATRATELKGEPQQPVAVGAELQSDAVSSSRKRPKKKKKIPVVFEFEADELAASSQDAALMGELAEEGTLAKRSKLENEVAGPSTAASKKNTQKKPKKASKSVPDFITFQSNSVAPTPLFCKTRAEPSTPLSSRTTKNCQTPNSDSKKVTFSLKNNKTAEFRKTDRSLLVNPVGSSRVPFDPKQKPKCGVLKSPPGSAAVKTTSKVNKKKTALNSLKGVRKQRPSAADFF